MSTRPFLEDVEKKWLAFQMLCGVRDCHARGIFHGDIKTENTLVTSWNWLYLSDFSSSFKPTILPEDNPADFSYFFDTAGRRTCYLAPERFLAAGEVPDSKAQVTWAMDVFSAGCVIAELFLETPIFTLSQLYKYRRGEYDPVITHLNRIADKEVREMVTSMIKLDPESRYTAEEYLKFYREKVFPDYFYSFLHQYMGLITDPTSGRGSVSATVNLGEADERIDRIYYDFDKISYFLDHENGKEGDVTKASNAVGLSVIPVHLDIPNNRHVATTSGRKLADDGTLLFLTLVVSSLRHTARATAKIRACDLLLAFSQRITDEAKLDRVLPYVVTLLSDKSNVVKVAAIRTLTQLMALVSVVSPVNAHVFPEYILPRMAAFLPGPTSQPPELVRAMYAACLGSLASTAKRFLDMVATLKADGTIQSADPELEDGANVEAVYQGLFDNSRAELIAMFELHTKALITDQSSAVKRAFLGSVPELCMFFGTADSNDIILSHLNTYLNDRDWQLKCAFFDTIVGVATFLGGVSLEEFILPLMVQALTDAEEFVVQKAISSFASMAELGLFQRSTTWELVDVVGRFTMHPNIWIREAAAHFLSAATIFLSVADTQCIIQPLIRPFLKTPLRGFSELVLLDNLKKPLNRALLDLAVTWVTKSDRGVFWKTAQQLRTFSFESTGAIPGLKDSGMNTLQKVQRNDEDEQWIRKLRNLGLSLDDEMKLLVLREYILRLALSKSRAAPTQPKHLSGIIQLRDLKVPIQTVMFDEDRGLTDATPHSETTDDAPHTIADALLDASTTIDDSIARRRRMAIPTRISRVDGMQTGDYGSPGASASPISPAQDSTQGKSPDIDAVTNITGSPQNKDTVAATPSSISSRDRGLALRHQASVMSLINKKDSAKSNAATGTTSANAFGKVGVPFSRTSSVERSPLVFAKEQEISPAVRFKGAHTYAGNDPSILKMLDAMYVENYPNDVAEFGPMIVPSSRRKAANKATGQTPEKSWRPEGVLVATFSEHVGPIHQIVVAPDHQFFLTGGDDGSVKVWDTGRLERNIAHRSRQTHKHSAGTKITALCFVEHTHSFVSCASDGSINVVRVDSVNSTGSVRYNKLRLLREYSLPKDETAVWAEHFKIESNSTLLVATNKSRLLAIDLRTMDILYTLDNPIQHGTPTCFVIDKKRQWLLMGTSHGILDLWDLRFRVRLKAWGVPGTTCIHKMSIHPTRGRGRWVCVAGGSAAGEVTVWDVEKTQCREVYRAGSGKEGSKTYESWPVDDDKPEGMLGRFATSLETNNSTSDRGVRAMAVGTDFNDDGRESKLGFLVTAGSDKKIRFWDITHVENSLVVSGLAPEESKPVFTSTIATPLTINSERVTQTTAATASVSKSSSGRPPRSTVISLQQQQLLKSHLDSILGVALLEAPYAMMVSVDRSGVVFIFQ